MTEDNELLRSFEILKESNRIKDLRLQAMQKEIDILKDQTYELQKEIGRLRDVLRTYER